MSKRLTRYAVTFDGTGPDGEQIAVMWGGYEQPPTEGDEGRLQDAAITAFEVAFGVTAVRGSVKTKTQYDIGVVDVVALQTIRDGGGQKVVTGIARTQYDSLAARELVGRVGMTYHLTTLGDEALDTAERTSFASEVRSIR